MVSSRQLPGTGFFHSLKLLIFLLRLASSRLHMASKERKVIREIESKYQNMPSLDSVSYEAAVEG